MAIKVIIAYQVNSRQVCDYILLLTVVAVYPINLGLINDEKMDGRIGPKVDIYTLFMDPISFCGVRGQRAGERARVSPRKRFWSSQQVP